VFNARQGVDITPKDQGLVSFDFLLGNHFESDINRRCDRAARWWGPGCMKHLAKSTLAKDAVKFITSGAVSIVDLPHDEKPSHFFLSPNDGGCLRKVSLSLPITLVVEQS